MSLFVLVEQDLMRGPQVFTSLEKAGQYAATHGWDLAYTFVIEVEVDGDTVCEHNLNPRTMQWTRGD